MDRLSWLAAAVAVLAIVLTWCLRRYALSRSLVDIPNARSSHSVPTPRGGGVAIVVSFLVALPVLYIENHITFATIWVLLGAGAAIAVLGFLDDHGHIAARWRLLVHFGVATWSVYWLGGMPALTFPGGGVELGWFGDIFAVFFLVWMLNLYNFMDGIDGLASIEALCVCFSACLIYWLSGYQALGPVPFLLSMAVLGFLCWNFPPARIFMGDAGSGFLGIILGLLALQAAWHKPDFLWIWLILLGVFIVDATFTLIRRLVRGERVYEAHRSHAYQYASRKLKSHLLVTLSVAVINLFWLLPVAICVALLDLNGVLAIAIAYFPLIILALKYNGGALEDGT